MSKKYISLITLFIICISLTGCADVIELTDSETVLIAEYAADLLLKYDNHHADRLEEGEKIEQEMIDENAVDDINGDVTSSVGATTEDLSVEQSMDTSEDDNGHKLNSQIDDNGLTDTGTVSESGEYDIARVIGLDGVSITYKDYIITDHYPATDADGEFIYLDASEGYQLLVLRFNVADISEDGVSFSLLDENVDYKIVCNNKNAANPMLTILMNDLGTMEAVLSPSEAQEGVLVFQISDNMKDKLDSMVLKVQYNDSENVINIL